MADVKCPKCAGCGQVADTEDQEPWSAWMALPVSASLGVVAGIVRPLTCPKCGGTGKIESTPHPAPMEAPQEAVEALINGAWDAYAAEVERRTGLAIGPRSHKALGENGRAAWAAAVRYVYAVIGGEAVALRGALELAAVRLEILTGRMRACHQETGQHELLDEADSFCREAREATRITPSAAAAAVTALVEAAAEVDAARSAQTWEEHAWADRLHAAYERLRTAAKPFLPARGGEQA